MQDIIQNMALFMLTQHCKDNGIDCSGTHLAKNGRGFKYSLVKEETGRELVTVTFYKNQVPHYSHSTEATEQRKAKVAQLRETMPGYILGELTPHATDSDVLEICELNNRKAEIHNRARNHQRYQS